MVTKEQSKLIEKVGVFYEKSGLNPGSSRILALLLIADKTEQTFDEIRETLNLSKSATSNGINKLLGTQQIEYITKPGDRKRYFRSLMMSWEDRMAANLQAKFYLNTLLKEIRENRTSETEAFNKKLDEVIDFMDYMMKEVPKVVEKWKNLKNK